MSNIASRPKFSRHLPQPSIGGTKAANKDHVHLSYGFPASELLPVVEFQEAAHAALIREREDALHYSGAKGPGRVREWVLNRLQRFGIFAGPDRFLAVFGAIQGIDLTARILLEEGDEAWVEGPTFFNTLQSFRAAGAVIRSFPVGEQGVDVDQIEEALREADASNKPLPKLLYVMPNYQNPTGVTLPEDHRRRLAELAVRYDFYIVEDDAYAELNFNGVVLPAIYTFAPDRVIYISTFSKTLGPGLRLGWVVAAPEVVRHMATLSLGSQSNPFTQEIVGELLQQFPFDEQVSQLIDRYRQQRDVMIEALHARFGNRVRVQVPDGGFFIWVAFDESVDVNTFAPIAESNGVSFVAGNPFFHDKSGSHYLRLCFSYCDEEQIVRGVNRLADAYEAVYGHTQ